MPRFVEELRRRNVFRAAAVYVAVAWGATEIIVFVFERFGFPDWTITLAAALFVAGFPVAMFVAWTFDIGSEGIRRAAPGSPQGRLAVATAGLLLIAGTAGLFYLIRPEAKVDRLDWLDVPFAPPPHSIAVLPFDVFTADQTDLEWLGDGFAETMLHYLASLDSLHVIARTSAFAFKEGDHDVRRIGRELSVANVLKGSIQRANGTLRITAQLIDARDGSNLWSAAYDRSDANLFEIQDEIAEAVSARLLDTLVGGRPAIGRATNNAEAYDLYLLGRYHWHKRSEEAIRTAIDYFKQAIALDPDYALAYSGLADAYSVLPDYSRTDISTVADEALGAAHTALQLAPDLAEGHGSVGLVRMQLGEFEEAEAAFRQAIALNPNYAMAHLWQGRALQLRGKFNPARRHHERALELDPLAPVVNLNLGLDLSWMGVYGEAVERFERAIELSPDMANAHFGAAVAHHHGGALAAAAQRHEQTLELGWVTTLTLREAALLYFDLGDEARADTLLERATRIADDDFVSYARRLMLLAQGNSAALVRLADGLLRAQPEFPPYLAAAGIAYGFAGDCETALGHFERIHPAGQPSGALFDHWAVLYGKSPAVAMLDCYLRLGRAVDAQALLEQIETHWSTLTGDGFGGARAHYFAAQLAAVQGQHEPAIAHLGRAVEAGWRQSGRALHDPALESLRSDQDFVRIIDEVAALVREERRRLEGS